MPSEQPFKYFASSNCLNLPMKRFACVKMKCKCLNNIFNLHDERTVGGAKFLHVACHS